MEKILQKLFEYQKFEKNAHLEKLISETEERLARELSDDDLSLVNAAGEICLSLTGGLDGKLKTESEK